MLCRLSYPGSTTPEGFLPAIGHFIGTRGSFDEPTFDLGMTVGTEEDALRDLGARSFERQCSPDGGDREAFLGRVDVMELQGAEVPVIAAKSASAARLGHELGLHAAAPAGDRLRPAAEASVRRIGASLRELGPAVGLAAKCRRSEAFAPRLVGGQP
jgi:hypothetical protein